MGDNLTTEVLEKLRKDYETKLAEVKKVPDTINDTVDDLKWFSYPAWVIVTDVRDDIQDKLKVLFKKLEEATEGMWAPWLFVDYASKWQVVGTEVGNAYGFSNNRDVNLEGRWDGSAYKAYKTTKEGQQTAMQTMRSMCEKIHDELLVVAEEGRGLYTLIVNKLATIIANVATFAVETPATAGAAAIWTVNNLNNAVVAAVELVVEAITKFVEVETKVYKASNELTNLIKHPTGIGISKDGKDVWPTTAKTQFDNKDDDWHLDGEDK
ncbi:hypothetical protein [Nocardia altamirensis]|uniref:hypothetical protein n=1 Tax=Nocardia altamirensis TaxID=472158 RepID=UPI0008400F04|nr:hypothetical protein [Nocardia altamirensis]